MRKFFAILAAAMLLFAAQNADARQPRPSVVKDSTWLASEDVMTSNIDQARGTSILGSIVAYPNFGNISQYVTDDYVECDGRAIPTSSDAYKKLGITRTPNLYAGAGTAGMGFFLRAGATPQAVSADKFESHLHGQPSHSHYTTGGLTSTAVTTNLTSQEVTGKAEGQKYVDWTNQVEGITYVTGVSVYGECSASVSTRQHLFHSSAFPYDHHKTAEASNLADAKVVNPQSRGNVDNRATTGTAHASGGDNTYYTGSDETAPTYYTTRYFMRINE